MVLLPRRYRAQFACVESLALLVAVLHLSSSSSDGRALRFDALGRDRTRNVGMAHSPLKEGDRLLYNGSEPEWQGARGEIEEIDTVGGRPVVSARWSLARDDDDSDDDQGGVLARTAAVRGSRAPRRTCRAAARPVSVDTTEDHYSVLSAADAKIYRQAWLDANPRNELAPTRFSVGDSVRGMWDGEWCSGAAPPSAPTPWRASRTAS